MDSETKPSNTTDTNVTGSLLKDSKSTGNIKLTRSNNTSQLSF